jgi:hypothetical protein
MEYDHATKRHYITDEEAAMLDAVRSDLAEMRRQREDAFSRSIQADADRERTYQENKILTKRWCDLNDNYRHITADNFASVIAAMHDAEAALYYAGKKLEHKRICNAIKMLNTARGSLPSNPEVSGPPSGGSTAPRCWTASSDSKQNPDGTYSDAEAM